MAENKSFIEMVPNELIEEFRRAQEEQPSLGDIPILADLIEGTGFEDWEVESLWNAIEPTGYREGDREDIIRDLCIRARM